MKGCSWTRLLVLVGAFIVCVSSSQDSAVKPPLDGSGASEKTGFSEHTAEFYEKSPNTSDPHDISGANHGHSRYQVFHFKFEDVQTAYVVSLWIFIASIAKIGFHLNNKLSSIFPESCLLIVLGIIVGIIVYLTLQYNGDETASSDAESSQYQLHATTFFHFLLPPIILDAGYFMPNRAFFNNLGSILLYAVIGTCWNVGTIGLTLYGVSQMGWTSSVIPLLHCLVFSSLISAVDPVAVLAVFEEIHVNEQLHIVVFGESLLNDAVTVVLYRMFMEYALQDTIVAIDVFAGILQFFIVGLGGVLIGVLFGMFCAFITKYTSHVRVIEPIFVFLLAYLSYLTAEMFHLSGIMALTFCGITMKNYVVFNISENSRTTIKYFLKMLSSMTETVIFMMLGTSAVKDNHVWDIVFIFVTILACLVFRTIGTVSLTFIANKFRVSKLKAVDQFVMAYGGLRGAIAFALAILINGKNFKDKDLFVTATILVVMFTVFVQGITIKPLVNALKVKKKQEGSATMGEQITVRLMDHMMSAVEDITGFSGSNTMRDKWEYYDNKYLKKVLLREKQMTKEHSIMRTHSKLSLKDAMHTMHSGFSTNNLQANGGQSLLRLISNWSVSSFQEDDVFGTRQRMGSHAESENDVQHNDTVVDMQALDAHFSKKIADDTKTHHMLEENLLAPNRSKLGPKFHQKHTIHEEEHQEEQSAYFHHNVKLHLRHMISKHQHHLQEKKRLKAKAKQDKHSRMPKNVSFANMAEPVVQAHYQMRFSEENEDDDDEFGIHFTAKSGSNGDVTDYVEPMEPVALECQLPWKRLESPQDEKEPVCSMATHLLPNDNTPALSQIPSWADNLDYNHIPAVSPRANVIPDATQLNGGQPNLSNNNSTSDLQHGIPVIPTIVVDTPNSSSANMLLMPGSPYQQANGSPFGQSNGGNAESSDDEEVEIKPFGRVMMRSEGSGANLKLRKSRAMEEESPEGEGTSDAESRAVQFSLHGAEESSEEEPSIGIDC